MKHIARYLVGGVGLAVLSLSGASLASAQEAEKRVALVIGNGSYADHPLATASNDAGLVAQTLQAAGFDVVGARDLDQTALRQSFQIAMAPQLNYLEHIGAAIDPLLCFRDA